MAEGDVLGADGFLDKHVEEALQEPSPHPEPTPRFPSGSLQYGEKAHSAQLGRIRPELEIAGGRQTVSAIDQCRHLPAARVGAPWLGVISELVVVERAALVGRRRNVRIRGDRVVATEVQAD